MYVCMCVTVCVCAYLYLSLLQFSSPLTSHSAYRSTWDVLSNRYFIANVGGNDVSEISLMIALVHNRDHTHYSPFSCSKTMLWKKFTLESKTIIMAGHHARVCLLRICITQYILMYSHCHTVTLYIYISLYFDTVGACNNPDFPSCSCSRYQVSHLLI